MLARVCAHHIYLNAAGCSIYTSYSLKHLKQLTHTLAREAVCVRSPHIFALYVVSAYIFSICVVGIYIPHMLYVCAHNIYMLNAAGVFDIYFVQSKAPKAAHIYACSRTLELKHVAYARGLHSLRGRGRGGQASTPKSKGEERTHVLSYHHSRYKFFLLYLMYYNQHNLKFVVSKHEI